MTHRARGDGEAEAKMFTEDNLPDLVFDHAQIVADYFAAVKGESPFKKGSAEPRK
jgi:hypothetical protein